MAFTDHKITAFTHTISELADQPNLPPDELKARFDACPEQLRVSLNAVCDEAAALDSKVYGILTQTFEGAVDKNMLSPELAAEIDAAAVETSVASRLETEAAARASADSGLSTRISSLESSVPQKARVVYGTYTGDGTNNRTISVGFRPRLVIASRSSQMTFYGMFTDMATMLDAQSAGISSYPKHLSSSGFVVSQSENTGFNVADNLNQSGASYGYIAIG